MSIDFATATVSQFQTLNPEVSGADCRAVYDITLQGYKRINADEPGLWLDVGVHSNTYGADANFCHLIETNNAAACEMLEDHATDYDRGALCVQVCDEYGTIDADALAAGVEIVEALEGYPLLDEEAYSTACWEQAAESEGEALQDAVSDIDSDICERCETEGGFDPMEYLEAMMQDGKLLWCEEECWAVFEDDFEHILEQALADKLRKDFEDARDNETLEMFS